MSIISQLKIPKNKKNIQTKQATQNPDRDICEAEIGLGIWTIFMAGQGGRIILFQCQMDVFPITKTGVCDQKLVVCKLKPNWVAERQAAAKESSGNYAFARRIKAFPSCSGLYNQISVCQLLESDHGSLPTMT